MEKSRPAHFLVLVERLSIGIFELEINAPKVNPSGD